MVSLLSLLFPIKDCFERNFNQNENINNNNNILLIGKEGLCKTSLLCQMSQTIAFEEYEDIHIIRVKTMERVPKRVDGMPIIDVKNGQILQFIKFVYLTSYESLVQYLSSFDCLKSSPTAIIIENVSHYLKQSSHQMERTSDEQSFGKRHKFSETDEKQSLAQLSALLINTANHCAHQRNGKCYTIMSFDSNQTFMDSVKSHEMAKSIGQRFYRNVWIIHNKHNTSGLKNYEMECISSDSVHKVDYYCKQNDIFLEKITKIQ